MSANQAIATREQIQGMQVVPATFGSPKMSLQELKELAAVYVESGSFPDLKNVAQAIVKIKAGEDLGFSPHVSIAGIHFFQGRAVIGANLLASLIKDSNKYEYKVLQHDDKVCSLQMMQLFKGEWRNMGVPVTYTYAQATSAGLTTKDVWKKFPADMLFAAVIRQSCRRYCADVLRGTPTFEYYGDEESAVDEVSAEQQSIPEQSETIIDSEEVIEGEPVVGDDEPDEPEARSEESELADLHLAVKEKINEITNGEVRAVAEILNGRVIASMDKKQLTAFLKELSNKQV